MAKKRLSKAKYTAYVAASIDGRISKNKNSKIDWTSREDWEFLQKSLKKTDAVIVGSNTYKVYKNLLNKRHTFVLTSKIKKIKIEGSVVFINPGNNNVKKFISSKGYEKVAVLGGSYIFNFCLAHKMLDILFLTIEPYIFTAGVPMFAGNKFRKYKFFLESIKRLNKNGTILLKYIY